MPAKELGSFVVGLINSLREEMIAYRENNIERIAELDRKKKIAELETQGITAKRKIEIEKEIEDLKMKSEEYLQKVKDECKQNVKDYKQYLESIDEMKEQIQETFSCMPKAMALTIHHHAKKMINEMWNSPDLSQRQSNEIKLMQFLTTIYEDTQGNDLHLPQKTIKLITEAKK